MRTLLENKIILIISTLVLILSFIITPFLAFADFNQQINYQGKLTDSSGVAVADGTYNMKFWLIASSTAATSTAVWAETRISGDKVQVTNGLFSVMLGEVTSLASVDFNQTLYLGVEIGGSGSPTWDGEMTPRKILGAVPAAFEAENAQTLAGIATTSFLRSDTIDTMEATSSSALLTLIQNGAGKLLSVFSGVTEMFTVSNNGNVGIATTTPSEKLTVIGNTYLGGGLTLTGALKDSTTATGTLGMVLKTTGTSTQWVATSTLGLGNGTFLGLTDTPSSFTANRLLFTNSGGTALTDSANLVFDGTNFGIGSTTPSNKLTVVGSSYISDQLLFDAADTESGVVFAGDNYLAHSSWKDMPDSTGILLPMYIYPSSIYTNDDYNEVIDMKKRYHNVPLYVILNPSNGAGGVTDGNFTVAIQRLKGAGAIVLGYVASNYTASTTAEVKAEIDGWETYYPEVDGIFIDEMTNTASTTAQSYYTELTRYIHGKGFYPSIGNPGAGTVGEYFASSTADVIVVHETGSYPSETTLKGDYGGGYADFDYNKRAGLVYNSATLNTASTTLLKKYLGLIYVTDDNTPNPWDTVSPHLENLFEMLSVENKRYFTDLYIDGNLGIGTTTPLAKLDITGSNSTAVLGSELISATADRNFSSDTGKWTGTNWSIGSGVITHTAGANNLVLDNTALSSSVATGTIYQITFTTNTTVAGILTPKIGSVWGTTVGQSTGSDTQTQVITAETSEALTFSPDGDWTGTIDDVSVKIITPSSATQIVRNSDGSVGLELRSGGAGLDNTFLGLGAGQVNTTGSLNTANGSFALYSNSTGSYNTANGSYVLYSNTTGSDNTANGSNALLSNTTGSLNTANGSNALLLNTTGSHNTANGSSALYQNTTGSNNTANGVSALNFNTTGSNNLAEGLNAGSYLADGSSSNASTSNSVFLGYDTRASVDGGINEIVIGAQAIGAGSNTVTLGSTTITKTILQGNVGIGSTTPSDKLTVVGNTYLGGGLTLTGALKDSTSATGTLGMIMQTTGTSTQWVATSTLGLGNGTFLGLTDTPSSFTANRLMFTNSGATALTDSASLVFDGTNFGIGTSTPNNLIQVYDLIDFNNTDFNSKLGYQAGKNIVSAARYNTFLGYQAGYSSSTGSTLAADVNTAVGYKSLYSNATGFQNTANGAYSLYLNTTGSGNTANGYQSLYSNTTGNYNIAIGLNSLYSNTTGSNNVVNGYNALYSNTTGSNNLAEGYNAGRYLANGSSANASTSNSVFLGYDTRASIDGGINEIVIGAQAIGAGSNTVTLGSTTITTTILQGNVGVGTTTPNSKLTVYGDINISDGAQGYKLNNNRILYASSTNFSTLAGIGAGQALLSDGSYNTTLGYQSLYTATSSDNNTAVGYQSLYSNTTGSNNTANGKDALRSNNTGTFNIANGNEALYYNISGGSNVAVGYRSLYTNTTGGNNIALGNNSGRYLTDSSSAASTTDYSLFLGVNTEALTNNDQNSIVIGYDANGLGSNTVVLGNDSITTTALKGNIGIATTTPSEKLTVIGNTYLGGGLTLTGALKDSTSATGTLGMVMQTTGTSTQWVATSTLGLGNGTFLGLTDTPSSFTANRLIFTNSGATALTDSANLTFDGTDFGVGAQNGIAFGGTRYLYASSTNDSVSFGENAGATFNSDTTYNTAIGFGAGRYASTSASNYNNFMGYQAGYNNTGNYGNVFGYEAGYNNSGYGNNLFGVWAGYNNTGVNNNMFGEEAGSNNSSDHNNLFGYQAGYNNTGLSNNMFGYLAGRDNVGGDYNNIFGSESGHDNTGDDNNIFGRRAGLFNTGSNNNLTGYQAGYNNIGSDNNMFGQYAGQGNTGSYNNFMGYMTGYSNTGSYNNIFGYQAGLKNTGSYNEMLGYETGYNLRATSSIIIGGQAFRGGAGTTAFQAVNNTALGYKAGYAAQTGASNNILLGYQAADNLTTGANNIVIGYDVDIASTTRSNQLNIGNLIFGTSIDGTGTTLSSGNIGIGTTTPSDKLTVVGNTYLGGGLTLTGALKDSTTATGTLGMILKTTGTSTQWVATSTLGLGNGTFLGLTDTPSSFTANRLMFTNSGATALTDSADLTFDGTNFGVGAQNGIAFGGTRYLYASSTNDSVAFGENAGATFNSSTIYNTAIGFNAGRYASTSASDYNNFMGHSSGYNNTGSNNNMFGFFSGYNNTGSNNNMFGVESGISNTSYNNNFMGYQSGSTNGGHDNNMFGYQAGKNNTTGDYNNIFGYDAGLNNVGDNNNIFGTDAGVDNTGYSNNIFGQVSGNNNTGNYNNIFGESAGENNTGSNNNLFGYSAGLSNTGSYNNIFGYEAGLKNTGSYNEMLGYETGFNLQSTSSIIIGTQAYRGGAGSTAFQAINNTALGYRAGYSAQTGASNNILLGYQAADNLTTGANNIVIGYDVDIASTTRSNQLNIGNLIFGTSIDGTGTTLSSGNIGIGSTTPSSKLTVAGSVDITNTATSSAAITLRDTIGGISLELRAGTSTLANTFVGVDAGKTNTTGSQNTSNGYKALFSNTTGSDNSVYGFRALYNNTTGSNNTALGSSAGRYLANGVNGNDTSSNSLYLGYNTKALADGGTNEIVIGYTAVGAGSNTVTLGSTTITKTILQGNIGIGTTTPVSLLAMEKLTFTGAGIAGINQYLKSTNVTASAVQYGNFGYLYASNTATTTIAGNMFKIEDNTTFGNTIRGFEVQTDRGTNTLGENTALSGFARTFGVRGTTKGDAGGTYEPAGVFAETQGTTQGNAIRGYSASITTTSLLKLFQDTSTFVGTGLLMNFGNSGGSFSSTTASKFIDLQNAGTSMFTVGAYGALTIGDGTTNHNAGLAVGYGGICVDNDGSCNASTTGRVSAVSYHTGNSDLAETYFSNENLKTGDVVYIKGGLSVGKAGENNKNNVIGVVSTKPGLLLGSDDASLKAGEKAYPIALKGRVPVRLSNENGEIKVGDELMLSSVEGVVMKATSTGKIVGVALEDFEGSRAYSDTYINQFGDDLVDPVFEPINHDNDPRINDGCYFGGGNASGDEVCVPLVSTTTNGQIAEAEALAKREAEERALAKLVTVSAEKLTLSNGQEVNVGQIVMFVDLRHRYLDDNGVQMMSALLANASTTNATEVSETVWQRVVSLANNFVDGVLSVFTLKADKVEVKDQLCVDGVCVTGDDLRQLLNKNNNSDSGEGTNNPEPVKEEVIENNVSEENKEATIIEEDVVTPSPSPSTTQEPTVPPTEPEPQVSEPTPPEPDKPEPESQSSEPSTPESESPSPEPITIETPTP